MTAAPTANVERVLAALWRRQGATAGEAEGGEARRRSGDAERIRRLSQRLGEQAMACVSDTMRADRAALVPGSADLLATLFALWAECGLSPDEIWVELHKREQLGSLLMQLNQAQSRAPRRLLKPWRVDSTKLP